MASNINDYILCADDHSLEEAIGALKSSPEVMMDCEGVDLGQQGGLLSLISLRTMGTEPSKTYLIDVFSLTNDKLRPLFDIIQSTSPTKIVFDGRMDFSELYHGSGITLHGVLDLQLVDVDSRRQRGEDEDEQLRRLSPYLHRREIFGQRNSYTKVHKLCGLGQCLTEHKIDGLGHKSVTHEYWAKRPLADEYLRYAARDVHHIELLYNHFKKEGYINDQLLVKSTQYVAIWKDAKPHQTDEFRSHPLLPLNILDCHVQAQTRSCVGCRRNLPQMAFSKAAWKEMSKRQCWVCRAINVRNEMHRDWDRDEDNDYGYDSEDSSFGGGKFGYDSEDFSFGGGGFGYDSDNSF